MKFYLAHSYEGKALAAAVIAELEARGHICTHDWTQTPEDTKPSRISNLDLAGIGSADLFILLLPARCGGHVEYGFALGIGVKTIVLGGAEGPCPFYTEADLWEDNPAYGREQSTWPNPSKLPAFLAGRIEQLWRQIEDDD